jgi:hypothetical protein
MLDSTEIKGAVRLKINHWPKSFFYIFLFPIFFDITLDRWDILKKSAQSCPGPNPLYTTRVTKPLKNPFLIFHGQGSWPRALTMKIINFLGYGSRSIYSVNRPLVGLT